MCWYTQFLLRWGGKPEPAANQNVSQTFTEQCKLHNFRGVAVKQFAGVSEPSVWCSQLFSARTTRFSISVFHAALAFCSFFPLYSGGSMWVCAWFLSGGQTAACQLMGSVDAAFSRVFCVKIKLMEHVWTCKNILYLCTLCMSRVVLL